MRIKLDIPLSIDEITNITGGINFSKSKAEKINYIVTDSREAEENDLFIALNGESDSGENYIEEAIRVGAIPLSSKTKENTVFVKTTIFALLDIAKLYKSKLKNLKHTVALTGSVGKTTTKEMLYSLLSTQYKVHKTFENQNNFLGVALTVLSAKSDAEILLCELGMNRIGEIRILSETINPDIAIITNIGSAHIGNLGDRKMIAKAKSEIVLGMTKGNVLVPFEEKLLKNIEFRTTVSTECDLSDFYLEPLEYDLSKSKFNFYYKDYYFKNLELNMPFFHNLSNLSFAISTSILLNINRENLMKGVEKLSNAHQRTKFEKANDFLIIDDSYNSSREAIFSMLDYLKLIKNRPYSALFGDVLELGTYTEEIHKEIGEYAFNSGVRSLFLFGTYAKFIMDGAISAGMKRENIYLNSDTEDIEKTVEQIEKNHLQNEIILIKASNKIHLERIIKRLKTEKK